IQQIRKMGVEDRTLIVITADHGESFGEHGEQTHGFFIYDATTHAPLIIRCPVLLPAKNKRVSTLVRSVDIFPTVLELLSISHYGKIHGSSLVPLISGEGSWTAKYSYSEAFIPRNYNWSELKGLRGEGWKYIEAPKPELYDLKNDPRELINLFETKKVKALELKKSLKELESGEKAAQSERMPLDQETIERLKSLGYLHAGGDPTGEEEKTEEMTVRRDPKDMIRVLRKFQRANSLSDKGEFASAEGLMKQVIEADPENSRFRVALGNMLLDRMKLDE
ncbi:unnamed protein product, partial [marine sediment metagenome]